MKKALCLLLSVIFIFSLTACNNGSKFDKDSVDIEYFAKLGQMPECEYSLGASVAEVKDQLSAAAEEDEEKYFYVDEGENTVLLDNGTYNFYYLKNKESDGISYIVNYATAYGFEIGTVILEVENALADFDYTKEQISNENAFFLLGPAEGNVIKLEFEENTIMFVFQNNALCATAIYLNTDWE